MTPYRVGRVTLAGEVCRNGDDADFITVDIDGPCDDSQDGIHWSCIQVHGPGAVQRAEFICASLNLQSGAARTPASDRQYEDARAAFEWGLNEGRTSSQGFSPAEILPFPVANDRHVDPPSPAA